METEDGGTNYTLRGHVRRFGTDSRLRIVQLLLSAHPDGMVAGEIQAELRISASNLSHHLDKLRNEGLVTVLREGTYLRYTANTATLEELLNFLYPECCTRNQAIEPGRLTHRKGTVKCK